MTVVTVTPSVADGTVVRWHRSLPAAEAMFSIAPMLSARAPFEALVNRSQGRYSERQSSPPFGSPRGRTEWRGLSFFGV